MNKPKETSLAVILVMGILFATIQVILLGIVIPALWGWFIIPVFNLDTLHFREAIGLAVVIAFLWGNKNKVDGKDTAKLISDEFYTAIFRPLFFWGLGWVIHLLMR